jgi:NitT/TauT family transport system permease protein
MGSLAAQVARLAYPAAGVLGLLAIWHGLVVYGIVPGFLLPAPQKVLTAGVTMAEDGTLWRNLKPTLQATVVGYMIGCGGASVLAALVAEFKLAERLLLLHLFAIQSIPKVSIAPLIFLWAGFDIEGKVVLVALICFFPVFANALAGFRASDPNLIDLLRAAGASRLHIFHQIKLPTALPHIFSGLEVAVAFALIGCIVMEFIGSTRGMGFVIQDSSNTFDLPLTFAVVILLGIIGVLGNALVRALRHRLLFWEQRQQGKADAG